MQMSEYFVCGVKIRTKRGKELKIGELLDPENPTTSLGPNLLPKKGGLSLAKGVNERMNVSDGDHIVGVGGSKCAWNSHFVIQSLGFHLWRK